MAVGNRGSMLGGVHLGVLRVTEEQTLLIKKIEKIIGKEECEKKKRRGLENRK